MKTTKRFKYAFVFTLVLFAAGNAFGQVWKQMGPYGGTVDGFLFHGPPNVVFAQCDRTVYRSLDGGLKWKRLSVSGTARIHPRQNRLIAFDRLNLYASDSLGLLWRRISVFREFYPFDIQFDLHNASKLYMLAQQNDSKVLFLISRDGGILWESGSTTNLPLRIDGAALQVDSAGKVWALVDRSSIYEFDPVRQVWNSASEGLPCCNNARSMFSVAGSPGVMWSAGERGIFKTVDGGRTWQILTTGNIWSLAQDPGDASTVYAAGPRAVDRPRGYALRTTDSGATWSNLHVSQKASYLSVSVDPRDSRIVFLGAEDVGVMRSVDHGKSWVQSNDGIDAREVLGVFPRKGVIYAYTDRQLLLTRDRGLTWQQTSLGNIVGRVEGLSAHPFDESIIAGYGGDSTFLSNDAGTSWRRLDKNISGGILFHPKNPRVLYSIFSRQASKTTDFGNTWRRLNDVPLMVTCCIESFDISRSNPPLLFVGADDGFIYRSRDDGVSWIRLVQPTVWPVYEIAVNPKNPDIIYAETSTGTSDVNLRPALLGSFDGGRNWTILEDSIQRIRVNPINPAELFSFEFYYPIVSTDSGWNWKLYNDAGIPRDASITDLQVDPTDDRQLYISTTRGVFSLRR